MEQGADIVAKNLTVDFCVNIRNIVCPSAVGKSRQQLNDGEFTLADAEVVGLAMFKRLRIHGWVRTADDYRNFGEDCLDPI